MTLVVQDKADALQNEIVTKQIAIITSCFDATMASV